MSAFTQQNIKEVLASIASGTVVECEEHFNALSPGVFKTLFDLGFIRGTQIRTLNRNWFVLTRIELTTRGRDHLAVLSADIASLG